MDLDKIFMQLPDYIIEDMIKTIKNKPNLKWSTPDGVITEQQKMIEILNKAKENKMIEDRKNNEEEEE